MKVDKKLLTLPIILIIALSVIGVGVAHWSDMVKINGYVQMGSLRLAYENITYLDEFKRTGPAFGDVDETEGGKPWVCNTTMYFTDWVVDHKTNKSGWQKLWINITNAYPCYEAHCGFVLHNIGSTPLDVLDYNITDPTGALTYVEPSISPTFTGDLVDANGTAIINVRWVNGVPYQLDPCDWNKMQVDLHIKQTDVSECHDYYFKIEIIYGQWDP